MDDNTIICRCSDVTLKEIRDLIKQGYTSLEEIKRITRAGMGPCQGRTCGQLIQREIAKYTGKSMAEIEPCTSRPPVKSLKIDQFVKGGSEDD
ncbi:(2Fe-2S)-binding protein [Abyssisolibacter fermentans]|uniref:(2Fe-2S)-binding protein n=1 Tax=Abyssisolibacter fermentans TaxID=1766203 RepID=UPI000832B776|nr:(2Fe-2S)-binding protein [Abyssisolibacter fermentans]